MNYPIAEISESATMPGMPATDFRKIIQKRMKELGWTKYELSARVMERGGKRDMVYRYVAGKIDTSTENLQRILDALDLKIAVSKGPKAK